MAGIQSRLPPFRRRRQSDGRKILRAAHRWNRAQLHTLLDYVNMTFKLRQDPDSVENLYANRDLIKDVYIWETSRVSNHQLLSFDAEHGGIRN